MLPQPPCYLAMNVHPDAVFQNFLEDTCENIPYIKASVSLELESVHIQMEEIRQKVQDTTSDYLIKSPTHNKNLLNTEY